MLEADVTKKVFESGESEYWDGNENSNYVGMMSAIRKDKPAEVKIRNLLKNRVYTVVIFGKSQWGTRFNDSFVEDVKINNVLPSVFLFGIRGILGQLVNNDILCTFASEIFKLPLNRIRTENNSLCDYLKFKETKRRRRILQTSIGGTLSSLEYSKLLAQYSGTLEELGLKPSILKTKSLSSVTTLIRSLNNLQTNKKTPPEAAMRLFIYPDENFPDQTFERYISKLKSEPKLAFLLSKFDLKNEMVFKNGGQVFGKENSAKFMPKIVENPIVRTESGKLTVVTQLNNEGIVFGIIFKANETTKAPTVDQMLGLQDGNGIAAIASARDIVVYDENSQLSAINLRFEGLTNEREYKIYFASGVNLPVNPILNQDIREIVGKPTNFTNNNFSTKLKSAAWITVIVLAAVAWLFS